MERKNGTNERKADPNVEKVTEYEKISIERRPQTCRNFDSLEKNWCKDKSLCE